MGRPRLRVARHQVYVDAEGGPTHGQNAAADFAELMGIATGYQRSRALMAATELGIADLLRAGPRPVADLAQATRTHEPTLYRLLRALASVGVFHEDSEQCFSLTSTGQLLRSDASASLGAVARLFGGDYHWTAWGHLLHSVRTSSATRTCYRGRAQLRHGVRPGIQ